jgi:hypothetical protein
LRASTRLVLVDADRDAVELRARHPDAHAVVIVPAVIGIQARDAVTGSSTRAARPARLRGYVREIPSRIHVPKPFSDVIRDIGPSYGDGGRSETRYRVHVRWGTLLEPWVTDVESTSKPAPR